jgi:hypothetical protein
VKTWMVSIIDNAKAHTTLKGLMVARDFSVDYYDFITVNHKNKDFYDLIGAFFFDNTMQTVKLCVFGRQHMDIMKEIGEEFEKITPYKITVVLTEEHSRGGILDGGGTMIL